MSSDAAGETRSFAGTYYEAGRGFGSLVMLAGVLVAGFVLDLGLGGARAHLLGWIVAAVLVLGVDLLVIHSARVTKSLYVDAQELRIGDEAVPRDEVAGVSLGTDPELPVLGWLTGLPRGRDGVTLELTDRRRVVVPTRRPDLVVAALGLASTIATDEFEPRPATAADLPLLAEVEDRAATVFRVAGLALPDTPAPDYTQVAARSIFVVGDPPFGFVRVDEVDGNAHVEEIDVLPARMRRGLGGRLLERACDWAAAEGYAAVTLITYAEVPWNAPFYRRHGFAELDPSAELTPGLAALREHEREIGLDELGPRVVMRRDLGSAPAGA